MVNFGLNLPIDIPWTLVNYNQDMMDKTFCDKKMPSPFRSSIALYTYNPRSGDIPEAYSKCGKQITYLKVSCSITGYQKTEEENQQIVDLLTSIKGVDYTKTDDILQEYFGCYGVLLNVSVHPERSFRDDLTKYPHIIDFEPKHHDIFQPASETGEVLTTSNLLTGYHSGTNRASFIMLPPPQISQPTDKRTFVQGLRAIEGIQDFFFIVLRDKDQPILNVDAFLQTGHFPEVNSSVDPPAKGKVLEVERKKVTLNIERSFPDPGNEHWWNFGIGGKTTDHKNNTVEENINELNQGYRLDVGEANSNQGIKETITVFSGNPPGSPLVSTDPNPTYKKDTFIKNVHSKIEGTKLVVTFDYSTDNGNRHHGAYFARTYDIFLIKDIPETVHHSDPANLFFIQRKQCTRITYNECISGTDVSGFDGTLELADGALSGEVDFNLDELINPDKIDRGVNPGIGDSVNPDIVTGRVTNSPLGSDLAIKKAILRKIQNTMVNTASSPVFLKSEKTGFLQTKHFQQRLLKMLPKEVLDSSAQSFDFINPKAKEKISKEISLRELFSGSDLVALKQFGISKNEILKVKKPNIGK